MSHSEFYERSPPSERIELLSMSLSSRSHSEEGNDDRNRDLDVLVQEYMPGNNKEEEDKKKH